MSFRNDINGLRALAVIGVVAYHFGFGWSSGGFVGVDVFFVVSGFLMTQIIMSRLEDRRFSLLAFYGDRLRRIGPALLVLVLTVCASASLLLNPLRLTKLSQDCIASLLFLSNILYLKEGGYFAAPAYENWLLHTWSLSLEFQFYLAFPLLLLGLKYVRLGHRSVICALLLFLVPSFYLAVSSHFTGGGTQDAAFYLLPARVWEFAVGALCVFAPSFDARAPGIRQGMHYVGCTTIVAVMVWFNTKTGWPSALTALPVAATAAVLLADRQEAWTRAPWTRYVGLRSYSIYLWHWPIAAGLKSYHLWLLPNRLVGVLAAFAFAELSYRFVEKQATKFVWSSRQRLYRFGMTAAASTLALASGICATHGLETVLYAGQPKLRAELADYRAAVTDTKYPQSCQKRTVDKAGFSVCTIGNPDAHEVLVIGDSFAEQLAPRYADLPLGSKTGITFVTRSGCPLLPGVDRRQAGAYCARWNDAAYAFADAQPFKRIVFVGSWLSYSQETLCFVDQPDCGAKLGPEMFTKVLDQSYERMALRWRRLKAKGKVIIALDIMPFGGGDPAVLYQKAIEGDPVDTISLAKAAFETTRSESSTRLARVAEIGGAQLIDPADFLCSNGACPIVEHGHTFFHDEEHLRSSAVSDARFDFLDTFLVKAP